MKNFKIIALLLFFALTVTFHSCQEQERNLQPRVGKGDVALGGKLNVAIGKLPTSFIPSGLTDAISSELGLHLHEGLLKVDPITLQIIAGLAETWSVDDAGTSYVFSLRKGAMFHADECFGNASREITASDFEYSFQQLCLNEAVSSTFAGRLVGAQEFHDGTSDSLEGIKVIDDYTLKVQLLKPDPSFLFVLAQPSTGVLSKKAVEASGADCIVGAGPFQISSIGEGITLVRNSDYYSQDAFGNKFPYIDTLHYVVAPDKENQMERLFNGEVDVVSGLYLDTVRDLLEQHVSDFSGKNTKYVLRRDEESVGYESYSVYRSTVSGLVDNLMGYRDFTRVQIKP